MPRYSEPLDDEQLAELRDQVVNAMTGGNFADVVRAVHATHTSGGFTLPRDVERLVMAYGHDQADSLSEALYDLVEELIRGTEHGGSAGAG